MIFKIIIILTLYANTCYSNNRISSTKGKTTIEADKVLLKDREKTILFFGNVLCRNEDITIKADKMLVKYDKKLSSDSNIKIKNIQAEGNIEFKSDKMIVNGDKGNYNLETNIIIIENNVIMNNEGIVVLGDKLTYDVATNDTKIDGIKKKSKNNKRAVIILDDINKIKDGNDNRK